MKGKWLYVALFVVGVCLGALLAGGGGVTFYKKNVFVDVKVDVDVGPTKEGEDELEFEEVVWASETE